MLSAACALSPSAAAPLLPVARALACSLRALLGTSPVASYPPLRAAVAGMQLCLRAVPSFLDLESGVPLSLQLRQRDARRLAPRRRGADVPHPPRGKGLGGDWCGCGWGWRGRGTSRSPCPLLLLRQPLARRLWPPLSRRAGGRGLAGRGGGAACRGRGCNPSRAPPAPFCGCGSPQRCARFLRRGYPPCRRRAGGHSRGRGVARWGCGLCFLRVWGPDPGRDGRTCCLGGGGGHLGWLRLLGRRWRPDQHRRLRQPPLLALRGGLPRLLLGDGGAGARPAVVAVVPLGGAIRVCHHCYPRRHAWWQARPSHYLLVHQCRAVGSAVRCSAGGREGGGGGPVVAAAPHGRGPAAIHRHWEGRRGSHAAHASRHSPQPGAGPRALGPRGSSGGVGGSRTRWTPVTAVTSLRHGGFPPKTSPQTAHNAKFLEGQPREWGPYKKIMPL